MSELARFRNQFIGFIFQSFFLTPRLTVLENVCQPLVFRGVSLKVRIAAARNVIDRVGLNDKTHQMPNELSGGQRQRVAIARALVGNPKIILADEPTGNLDTVTASSIIDLLEQLHRDGATIVIVTHDEKIANHAQRIVKLQDGQIESDTFFPVMTR